MGADEKKKSVGSQSKKAMITMFEVLFFFLLQALGAHNLPACAAKGRMHKPKLDRNLPQTAETANGNLQ